MTLRDRISEDTKTAMKARDSERLSALRLLSAALKQKEVDERIELADADVIQVIEKMLKQRRESIAQFEAGGRVDLAEKERFEIDVLQRYMPQPLSDTEVAALVAAAICETGAAQAKDIGKVMAVVKPRLAGRADMARVSALIKAKLG